MDFHTLSRKDLQTLCKKNKIPANITNVAMADALKALETVEGLDELMNQSQSPEKVMNKPSQEIPSTVTRTSTRRKAAKEEPQSIQPTTRTRRGARKALNLDEENKNVNVNVPDSPATAATSTRRGAKKAEPQVEELKKADLLETPALPSGRRRAGAGVGSTRRKVEAQKEECSVQQHVYGTRRSVRLLEKSLAGLSLTESGQMETVKVDEVVENGTEENKNDQSGSEVPLARNLSVSLDDERDFKDEEASQNSDKLNSLSALDTKDESCNEKADESAAYLAESSDRPAGTTDESAAYLVESSDKPAETTDETFDEAASHHPDNFDHLLALDAKDESPNEKSDESSAYLAESADKQTDVSDVTIDPKGSVDVVAVSEDTYEIDNLNVESVADHETKSIALEDVTEEVLNHTSSADLMGPIEVGSGEENANQAPQETECQNLVGKECDDINVVVQDNRVINDIGTLPKAEESDDGKASQSVAFPPEGLMDSSENLGSEESEDDPDEIEPESDDDSSSEKNSFADELEDPLVDMENEEALFDADVAEAETTHAADEIVIDSNIADASLDDLESDDDSESDMEDEDETVTESDTADDESDSDDVSSYENSSFADELEEPVTDMESEEELFDVNVAEASPRISPKSVAGDISVEKIPDVEASVDVKPAEESAETTQEILQQEKSPTAAASPLVSNVAITSSMPLSPLAAQMSQPARLTPRKSSSKKQAAASKVAQVSDINKENTDNNSVKEVKPTKEKKTKKVLDDETMQDLPNRSLNDLKKLARKFGKLKIADNMKNKEDNESKPPFGNSRAALQTLPQNCMHAAGGEAEKAN